MSLAILHHPGYRTKFADNLKRDLPRIPFAPDFKAFANAGKKLADLHLNYESGKEYPLKKVVTPGVPLSYVVADKMKLNKDKTELRVNDSLTLTGIPPEVFEYRLGNRSALDWVIDQYRVTEDARSGIVSDPNREDDRAIHRAARRAGRARERGDGEDRRGVAEGVCGVNCRFGSCSYAESVTALSPGFDAQRRTLGQRPRIPIDPEGVGAPGGSACSDPFRVD